MVSSVHDEERKSRYLAMPLSQQLMALASNMARLRTYALADTGAASTKTIAEEARVYTELSAGNAPQAISAALIALDAFLDVILIQLANQNRVQPEVARAAGRWSDAMLLLAETIE